MKRPVQSGTASLKALGAVVVLGAAAHASLPYLPLIGPPALRVQAVHNTPFIIPKLETASDQKSTNVMVAAGAPVSAASTNLAEPGSLTASNTPAPSVPPAGDVADKYLSDTFTASVFAMPTPDLLGITPQMLATYFHPLQSGTNAALVGPFHVSFIPPLPPDKSSHAEYIIK